MGAATVKNKLLAIAAALAIIGTGYGTYRSVTEPANVDAALERFGCVRFVDEGVCTAFGDAGSMGQIVANLSPFGYQCQYMLVNGVTVYGVVCRKGFVAP